VAGYHPPRIPPGCDLGGWSRHRFVAETVPAPPCRAFLLKAQEVTVTTAAIILVLLVLLAVVSKL